MKHQRIAHNLISQKEVCSCCSGTGICTDLFGDEESCLTCNGRGHFTYFECTTCGLVGSSLTTDCPGYPCKEEKSDDVHQGRLDFVNGQWIEYDIGGATFGLCLECEADLSKRSTAWAGKRKPLCQKEATSTKGTGRPRTERPIKTVSQRKAVVKQPKEKPLNRAEILRRDEKTLLGLGVGKCLPNQGGD